MNQQFTEKAPEHTFRCMITLTIKVMQIKTSPTQTE